MIRPIESPNFCFPASQVPVIDVRSPAEYHQGHVPGAVNIPVFGNEERAVIGKLYVQTGKGEAILKGLDFALPKTDWYLREFREHTGSADAVFLYCWRGGLRSMLMARVFEKTGLDVHVLSGGYKMYRSFIREQFSLPVRLLVVGGYTGSGKTELLHAIASKGEQIIDLEGLACHKGSVFGALGQPGQPTNEQFENNLFMHWSALDFSRRVWIEDESRMIGRITLPDPVSRHISEAPLIRIGMNRGDRIERLVNEYAGFDASLLSASILKITERLGGTRTQDALAALESGRYDTVADIVLAYYDKAYEHSIQRRVGCDSYVFQLEENDLHKESERVIRFASEMNNHEADLPGL
jgi:tRNA 2-selenouridine synthase